MREDRMARIIVHVICYRDEREAGLIEAVWTWREVLEALCWNDRGA